MTSRYQRAILAAATAAALHGCSGGRRTANPGASAPAPTPAPVVRTASSAGAAALARGWAAERARLDPGAAAAEISIGAPDAAVAIFLEGNADLALTTRKLRPDELAFLRKRGATHEPRDFVAGYDALCVYVHPANTRTQISLPELADLYGKKGATDDWARLGVKKIRGSRSTRVVRVQPQADTSAHDHFRRTVLGDEGRARDGALEANTLPDILALVASTPAAIAYGRCGSSAQVKTLSVARGQDEAGVAPTPANMADASYPLARPLLVHLAGGANEHVKRHLDWVLSEDGQRVVERLGYLRR